VKDIHLEYNGYPGNTIKQADVILLAFPLMFPMTDQRKRNNLAYYSQRTDKGGPAMTFSMETVGWLDIGKPDEALAVWPDAYANAQKPFLVWTETAHPPGGAVNFITGAGGFLQGVLSGLGGLRLTSDSLAFNPQLLKPISSLKFSIYYLNNQLELSFDSSVSTIVLKSASNTRLLVRGSSGSTWPLLLGKPLTIPTGAFSITAQSS